MTYKFVNRPLENGLYEPEGIYLSAPFRGAGTLLQEWGAHPQFHSAFRYNGTALKGHPGVDFGLAPDTVLLAVDSGRVMEISVEPGGFERYLKLEHRWGESFYAHVGPVSVESGQMVSRGTELARSDGEMIAGVFTLPHLHFAIRIAPYNRFNGWGGFTDPLPFLDPAVFVRVDDVETEIGSFEPPPFLIEQSGTRRP
jgi:murein DD-endopeptidase MepM/ murein hydrolase activator NlpD